MSIKIQKCPFCRKNDTSVDSAMELTGDYHSCVQCNNCSAQGPIIIRKTLEEAELASIIAWNVALR